MTPLYTTHEEIIQAKKANIIRIAYQQGKVFKRFKEKEKFIQMAKKISVSKSTIIFKINVLKLFDKYPRLINSSVNLNFLKTYLKEIKEICSDNLTEFK